MGWGLASLPHSYLEEKMATQNKTTGKTTAKKNKKSTAEVSTEQLIAQLMKKVEELETQVGKEKSVENVDVENNENIRSDEYIWVMSLIPWRLSLSTGRDGDRPYNFERLYEKKRILYSRLVDIIDNHWSFLEKGLFYVLDKRVVRQHGLDDTYEKILSMEKIEKVLKEDKDIAYPIFNTANERQQRNIAQIMINMLVAGENLDQNMILAVSADTNIDINEKVKDVLALNINSSKK